MLFKNPITKQWSRSDRGDRYKACCSFIKGSLLSYSLIQSSIDPLD